MKIIHRQILKEHISLFLLIGSCLLGLILVGRMLQLREMLLSQNLGALDILRLFVYLSPFFMLLLTPIACMLSVFLTFLRMASDRELTALKASGVSLYQLLPAPIIFCTLCTLFSLFISLFGVSWGMEQFKLSLMEFARTKTKLSLQAGVFNQEFPGLTIYAQQVDLNSGDIRFVFVQDKTSKSFTTTVVAPDGTVTTDSEKEQIKVVFRNGKIFRREGEKLDVLSFGTYAVRLPLGGMLRQMGFERTSPKELSFEKLLEYDADVAKMKEDFDLDRERKVKVEIQKRLALPMACLVLGLFSVPIACVFRALKQQHGLILALGVFLVYYSMLSVFESMGESRLVPPAIGIWVPNILFSALGYGFLRQAVRERVPSGVLWVIQRLPKRSAA
ncbi:MAG TPA: LPS export ABC transporter permease LptF [Humidesulfovibrio sp.]|uniref:LPS export ABC transporter permease LptF n=1 Tax=Humidesulfovibrio sp. TaxID=2910988 RepID=UPI002BDACA5A|nr:LPS export ABC transporter permease LptF [Humidesulfovibrio sp.]HWR03343.1 LPS export ABC transporter permease LptF [Humidesulfovibrio sp.]